MLRIRDAFKHKEEKKRNSMIDPSKCRNGTNLIQITRGPMSET